MAENWFKELVQESTVRIAENGALYHFIASFEHSHLGVAWALASEAVVMGSHFAHCDRGCTATRAAATKAIERAKMLRQGPKAPRRQGRRAGTWPSLPRERVVALEMIPAFRDRHECLPRWWTVAHDLGPCVEMELAVPIEPYEFPTYYAGISSHYDRYAWNAYDWVSSYDGTTATVEEAVRAATGCVSKNFLTAHCRMRLYRMLADG